MKDLDDKVSSYTSKVKKAALLLLYKRHLKPGMKGWELRKALGKDYNKILKRLDAALKSLGLQVKAVYESVDDPKNLTEEQLDKARYYVTVRDPLTINDIRTSGWRIDNVSALAIAVAYISSKQGKAPRKEVETILQNKFPKWRVDFALNQYIRRGYLTENEEGILYLDWRARAEIDQKILLKLTLGEAIVDKTYE